MTDIEIPFEKDRSKRYRFFEILPGALSWSMLALPVVLSYIDVKIAAVFVFVYLLINFSRTIAGAIRILQGYREMRRHQKLDWTGMLAELEDGAVHDFKASHTPYPKWHYDILQRLREQRQAQAAERADAKALGALPEAEVTPAEVTNAQMANALVDDPVNIEEAAFADSVQPVRIKPSQVIHAIIVATYKEAREVLEPTIQSILDSDFDMKRVIFVLAYEERGGNEPAERAEQLVKEYGGHFMHAMAVKHPKDIPGELIGKGGNVTYAGRQLQKYLEKEKIDPVRVLVTTLDADNHPDKAYLPALTYTYSVCPDPVHASFQPVSLYTNNIWDAPAPMRVVATGNSFFNIVLSLRQHALRNFSSHAQPMAALLQTDFWSVRTIVEDGHQFWRSYFAFDGNYRVYPLFVPIYQDAVLADGYVKTLKAQFVQLRRWTYGASDVAYVVSQGFFKRNKVPRFDLFAKLWRLLEGHITWATGPTLVLVSGFIPALFNNKDIISYELPIIVSRIQTIALIGVVATLFFSLVTLPPKPARYKRHRSLFMILQWVYLPVTTIIYNSFAAFNSQTRLMFGWYLDKFDVTEKAVVTDEKKTVV